ncbi:MAG: hypothetical protein E7258_01850 [Lachnospiraceae bacterium]|nr:hypothetical protein [Lachnospiraceae bacterium]
MLERCFEMWYGYRVHIILFIVMLAVYFTCLLLEKTKNIHNTSYILVTKIHIIFLLTEALSLIHNEFFTLGDNLFEDGYYNRDNENWLFYRIEFEGWLGYIIILTILLIVLRLQYGKRETKLNWKYNIGLVLLTIIGVFLTNFINVFSVGEICGLECDDFTYEFVCLISKALFGDECFLYIATNVLIPMALTIYVVIMIALCIPRMNETKRQKSIKGLRILNNIALIFMIYYFAYDMFVTMESWSYAPMIVVNRVVQFSLVSLKNNIGTNMPSI